jgi:hypothetical protein
VGFLDSLLGRSRTPKPAKQDRLWAMSTAHVTLDTSLQMRSAGKAGIVFQAEATADFARIVADAQELLHATGEETGTKIETQDDKFGYRWVVLSDPDVEDLVVGISSIKDSLDVGGYGARILAAVFRFTRENGRDVFFIYNIKRGFWYPFVPADGEQVRDNEAELRLKAQLGGELPMEPELERWFPLWGVPL